MSPLSDKGSSDCCFSLFRRPQVYVINVPFAITMKILIVGATSGIGRALFELYVSQGHDVAVVGRRQNLLNEMRQQYSQSKIYTYCADVTDIESTPVWLNQAWQDMEGVDIAVVSAGGGELNPQLEFARELPTLNTNVVGWTCLVDEVFNRFVEQGKGHLAVISSVGGQRGEPSAPAYTATKAFQMNYAEALRKKARKSKLPIYVTDIRPGFVDTKMAQGVGLFWVMPTDKVARQIACAIRRRRSVAVVTKRWRPIHFVWRHLPRFVYDRL